MPCLLYFLLLSLTNASITHPFCIHSSVYSSLCACVPLLCFLSSIVTTQFPYSRCLSSSSSSVISCLLIYHYSVHLHPLSVACVLVITLDHTSSVPLSIIWLSLPYGQRPCASPFGPPVIRQLNHHTPTSAICHSFIHPSIKHHASNGGVSFVLWF